MRHCVFSSRLRQISPGSTMPLEKVKTNSKYQKQMDKSFAVIFHNLKRIEDDKASEGEPEMAESGSSEEFRKFRSYSLPQERSYINTCTGQKSQPKTHVKSSQSMGRQRSRTTIQASKRENRKVSFSADAAICSQ